ncbi:MAG: MFS transporter [Chloroflexi bacterium]|nr:MAG: MFS transporter [Chloroflexota bacterium]
MWRAFASQTRVVQVLLVNELTLSLSVAMLFPYLATYFSDDLGFAAWMVGLALGLRAMSQQGLSVVGGTLADRLGYKPVIIAGLVLRALGFALFGLVSGFVWVLLASVLSGFAGALFSPALRAYLAVESHDRRTEAFALSNVAWQIGTLAGPLLGVVLLSFDFQVVALTSASCFIGLILLQLRYLPPRHDRRNVSATVRGSWGEVLRNRAFLLFAFSALAYPLLWNQIYLSLPLEVERLTGSGTALGLLFALSSVISIVGQLPATAYCQARWTPAAAIAIGLALMTLAWLPPLLGSVWLPQEVAAGWAGYLLDLSPGIGAVLLLTVGSAVAYPFLMESIPRLGNNRNTGAYFGFFWTIAGIGTIVSNTLTGVLFDIRDRLGIPALPWIALLGVGSLCISGILLLERSGRLATTAVPREQGVAP